MPGYIYCITNPQYKIDDIYKLGYTAINLPFEDVKKKLLLRYETYFISPECVELFLVNLPVKAEKKLFIDIFCLVAVIDCCKLSFFGEEKRDFRLYFLKNNK